MSVWVIALFALDAIFCIGLVASVLLQSGHSAGISGAIAGAGENIFGKKRGMDEVLSRITTVFAAAFLVISVVLAILMK